MRLEITTTPMILNFTSKNATLEKAAIPENVLDIKTEKFSVDMKMENGNLKIDQNQCFNEAGLKDIKAFMDDYVNYSKQAVSDGVDRIVSEGNSFADIHNNVDAVAQNADNNAYGIFEHEYNLDFIPKSRPKINYTSGKVNIDYRPGKIVNNSLPKNDLGTYTPGNLDIYVKQMNSIKIKAVRDKFDEFV